MLPKIEAERKQCLSVKQLLVLGNSPSHAFCNSSTLCGRLCELLESVRTILHSCSLAKLGGASSYSGD